ncbi:hypothetical protein NH340_JMT02055 [Sarcoptes scabiei]|nr:hypothetical protein NH340_JMT02055 [Sarcoptes scabiei]
MTILTNKMINATSNETITLQSSTHHHHHHHHSASNGFMFPASYYHRSYPGNGHSYPFYHQHQLTTNPGPPLIPSRLDASDDVHVTVLQIDQNQQQQLKKNQYWLNNDQNYPRTNINNSNHNKNDGTIYTNLSAEVMNSTKIENFSNLNNNNNNNNFQQFFHSQNDLNLLKQNQNDFDPERDLNSDFVTVLKIASTTGSSMMTTTTTNSINENLSNGGFNAAVSVSAVGGGGGGVGGCHNQTVHVDNKRGEIDEEVTIYRLPGERLGMALRFDGGQSATETIRRVFVQSISMNSPSSKAIGLMLGMLREGDEILQIDGRQSSSLTRLECITLLRDAPVCIKLFVRRTFALPNQITSENQSNNYQIVSSTMNPSMPVPNLNEFCQMQVKYQQQQLQQQTHHHSDNYFLTKQQLIRSDCLNTMQPVMLSSSMPAISSMNSNQFSQNVYPNESPVIQPTIASAMTTTITSTSMTITSANQTKKVPPPVPPRMATTTLSSRKKSRPSLVSLNDSLSSTTKEINDQRESINQMEPIVVDGKSCERTNKINCIEPEHQQSLNSMSATQNPVVLVEKPPRRKNYHNNSINNCQSNPPPLPPRRPKGPPPKPPIDHHSRSSSTSSASSSSSSTSSSASSLSSTNSGKIVNVIEINNSNAKSFDCVKTTATTEPSNKISIVSTPMITSAQTISTTVFANKNHSCNNLKNSSSSKGVTFHITNSKVSSFIRNTAEKLHRKLSGRNHHNDSHPIDLDEEINKSNDAASNQSKTNSSESNAINGNLMAELSSKPSSSNDTNNPQFNIMLVGSNRFDGDKDSIDALESSPIQSAVKSDSKSKTPISVPSTTAVSMLSTLVSPPVAAHYDDAIQQQFDSIEESFESDTDDTSSSVSTIIERQGSFRLHQNQSRLDNNNDQHNSNQEFQQENDDYERRNDEYNYDERSDIEVMSIVERVLSPFEFTDDYHQQHRQQQQQQQTSMILAHPLVAVVPGAFTATQATTAITNFEQFSLKSTSFVSIHNENKLDRAEQQLQQLPMLSTSLPSIDTDRNQQLSSTSSSSSVSNKTTELIDIDDGQLSSSDCFQPTIKTEIVDSIIESSENRALSIESPASIVHKNTVDRREKSINDNRIQISDEEDHRSTTVDEINEKMIQINRTDKMDVNQSSFDGRDEKISVVDDEDDEDLDAIKNDLFSRLDDDKDDFMIDTDYINESSSRFLFHPNSSELILPNSYSELSSITEEDEEDETNSDCYKNKNINQINDIDIDEVQNSLLALSETERKKEEKQSRLFQQNSAIENDPSESNDWMKEEKTSIELDCSKNIENKISLNNVFEFLSKATDDFEFVERMLELTNDRIDSIDDIMRIRESLRGLQESEQRENLKQFLDGKDVCEELIALSSSGASSSPSSLSSSLFSSASASTPSSASSSSSSYRSPLSSPDHEYLPIDLDKLAAKTDLIDISKPKIQNRSYNDEKGIDFGKFDSLPHSSSVGKLSESTKLCYQSVSIGRKMPNRSIENFVGESKIPTLTSMRSSTTNLLQNRSQSTSNLFNQTNQFHSLTEVKPSLIPRPISNFNLSLPTPPPSALSISSLLTNGTRTLSSSAKQHETTNVFRVPPSQSAKNQINRSSHNCLNRSSSMQSIFQTTPMVRSSSGKLSNNQTHLNSNKTFGNKKSTKTFNGQSSSNNHSYHHNCLNHSQPQQHQQSPYHYGSLSRTISKSTHNVYNTGSLPRPVSSSRSSSSSSMLINSNLNNNQINVIKNKNSFNRRNNIINHHHQLQQQHQETSKMYRAFNGDGNYRTTSLTDLSDGPRRDRNRILSRKILDPSKNIPTFTESEIRSSSNRSTIKIVPKNVPSSSSFTPSSSLSKCSFGTSPSSSLPTKKSFDESKDLETNNKNDENNNNNYNNNDDDDVDKDGDGNGQNEIEMIKPIKSIRATKAPISKEIMIIRKRLRIQSKINHSNTNNESK